MDEDNFSDSSGPSNLAFSGDEEWLPSDSQREEIFGKLKSSISISSFPLK